MTDTLSDKEIIKMFREDNPDYAFHFLVQKYQERLYFVIRKILIVHEDTDDILQESFIKIYQNLGEFRGDSELFSWMYRIAVNEALNYLRKQKRKHVFSPVSYEDKLSQNLSADAYFDGDEAEARLQKAILSLPQKQRLVFNMKYYDNLKYDDMSEILKTSTGALKASYHHAVKKIEKYLKSD
ncbi:MAG: sigma-70 family RNA polymerase sigma factor [Bacteroidales bacterium]